MTPVRARLAAAALIVVAVWEVAVLVTAGRSAPTPGDWQATSAALPRALSADQLIVFAPRWMDPVGRRWLGSRLTIAQAARMDAVAYRDVWEVSARGARAPEVAGETPVSTETFGAIRVRHFTRDAPRVTWMLTQDARVCEIDFEPHRGVTLELQHPSALARREFHDVELGTELQVYAGLDDYKRRSRNRATAFVQVAVDGRVAAHGTIGNDDGWMRLPAAVTEPGLHSVAIEARVLRADGPVDQSVCVAAEARMRRP